MKISVQTGGAEELFGIDGAFREIKEAGFDCVDADIHNAVPASLVRAANPLPEVLFREGNDFLSLFRPWKEASLKYGLPIELVHCIYPIVLPKRSLMEENPGYNELLVQAAEKFVIASADLGCRNLVCHPACYVYADRFSEEFVREKNMEIFSRIGKRAKTEGVTVCLENVFTTFGSTFLPCVMSWPEDAVRFVDALNEDAGAEVFGFCLDTGHAMISSEDNAAFVTKLGSRLKCLHVHDNDGRTDQHLLPYMGIIDWDRFTEALGKTHYSGAMNFETFKIWERFGAEMGRKALRFLLEIGRHFVNKTEQAAKDE